MLHAYDPTCPSVGWLVSESDKLHFHAPIRVGHAVDYALPIRGAVSLRQSETFRCSPAFLWEMALIGSVTYL